MKAAFITEGRTMTHSALSRRSFGISSGTLRISAITLPAFLMRLFSSFCAYAGKQNSVAVTNNKKIRFISLFPSKPSLVRVLVMFDSSDDGWCERDQDLMAWKRQFSLLC